MRQGSERDGQVLMWTSVLTWTPMLTLLLTPRCEEIGRSLWDLYRRHLNLCHPVFQRTPAPSAGVENRHSVIARTSTMRRSQSIRPRESLDDLDRCGTIARWTS